MHRKTHGSSKLHRNTSIICPIGRNSVNMQGRHGYSNTFNINTIIKYNFSSGLGAEIHG